MMTEVYWSPGMKVSSAEKKEKKEKIIEKIYVTEKRIKMSIVDHRSETGSPWQPSHKADPGWFWATPRTLPNYA